MSINNELLSDAIAFIIASATLLLIGYQVPGLESTSYPDMVMMLVVQVAIGGIFLDKKKISPPKTPALSRGEIDLKWGFKRLWWTLWWPFFIGVKK